MAGDEIALSMKRIIQCQYQFSPNNNHKSFREKVVRIDKMMTEGKSYDLLSNSLNKVFKEMYGDQSGELVRGYWDLE